MMSVPTPPAYPFWTRGKRLYAVDQLIPTLIAWGCADREFAGRVGAQTCMQSEPPQDSSGSNLAGWGRASQNRLPEETPRCSCDRVFCRKSFRRTCTYSSESRQTAQLPKSGTMALFRAIADRQIPLYYSAVHGHSNGCMAAR